MDPDIVNPRSLLHIAAWVTHHPSKTVYGVNPQKRSFSYLSLFDNFTGT